MADKREELLKMLNKALLFEEAGIVIYGNTYRTFVEKNKISGLKAAEKERIIKILNHIIEDSEKHRNLLRTLIGKI